MSGNILEPLVVGVFDVAKLSGKLLLKLLNIKEHFNIEEFFKTVGLKNKKDEYLKQIKLYSSEKGYVYLLAVPFVSSCKSIQCCMIVYKPIISTSFEFFII